MSNTEMLFRGFILFLSISAIIGGVACWTISLIAPEEVRPRRRLLPRDLTNDEYNTKSLELFKSYLTPDQLYSYNRHRCIVVQGNITKHKYDINCNRVSGNIYNRLTGRNYCMVSAIHVPLHDTLLAQKLIIECDEQKFLATAFVS